MERAVEGWRAYYEDGSTYASSEYDPEELPGQGILGVVVFWPAPYRKTLFGGDWYWWDGETWHESDTVWDDYVAPPEGVPGKHLKRSGRLPDDDWAVVQKKMLNDNDRPS